MFLFIQKLAADLKIQNYRFPSDSQPARCSDIKTAEQRAAWEDTWGSPSK